VGALSLLAAQFFDMLPALRRGPCSLLANHFSNMFYDHSETMQMSFVRAPCDDIKQLSEFRDQACPKFVFYLVQSGTK